ncbi:phosphatidylglycerophosphatase A [Candidatus Cloacimonadota bacterium]
MNSHSQVSGISKIIATLGGIGYIPGAPGTAGTVAAATVYFLLPGSFFIDPLSVLPLLFLLTIFSVYFTGVAEKVMTKDDKHIVLDEFTGFFYAVIFLPKNFVLIIIAFILFRVFDIFKPFPINLVQKLKGGWGIMADDILAGIFTNICLRILILIVIMVFPKI